MINKDDTYRKKCQFLKQSVLKNINIEIMMLYLKPDERRALYCMLCEATEAEYFMKYKDMAEIVNYFKTKYEEKYNVYDNISYTNLFAKCKNINTDFINKFPSTIFLDLNDSFQNCIYTYSKIIYRNIFIRITELNFNDAKDIYYSYEKVISDNVFNKLEPCNLFFNLILLQGILSEIKEGRLILKDANLNLVNTILIEKIYHMMTALIVDKQNFVQDRMTEAYTEYTINTVSELEEKKDKLVEKFKEEVNKNREKLNSYEEKLKFYQKNNNDSLLNRLYEDIRKKDAELDDIKNELLRKNEVEANRFDVLYNKIQTMNTEKERLLLKIKELEVRNAELKTIISEAEEDNLLSDINKYISKYGTEKIIDLLHMKENLDNKEKAKEASENTTTSFINFRIGYATLTGQGIEIITSYGSYPVNKIPEKSIIGEGQFIRIDTKNNFINSYRYYTQHKVSFHLNPESKFGEIKYINGKPFIDTGSNMMQPVSGATNTIQEGQLVFADNSGKINIFFKKMNFVLDFFYEIIKFRGLELWRINDILNNMCIIENIETKKKEVFNIPEDYKIKLNDILLKKADSLINIFDFRFYSHSRYYNSSIQGTAQVEEDVVMLVKSTGEKVIIKNLINISNIETGDTITIDEYNNLIRYEKNSYLEKNDTPKRKNLIQMSDKFKVNQLIVNKQVLIIGNPAYQQSYKLNFLKNGYQAEIIDGFSSWSKIQKHLKNIDIVVVIVSFASHDNMWQIKENVKGIPVIYPDSDGANRIIEQLENYYNENEVAQTIEA